MQSHVWQKAWTMECPVNGHLQPGAIPDTCITSPRRRSASPQPCICLPWGGLQRQVEELLLVLGPATQSSDPRVLPCGPAAAQSMPSQLQMEGNQTSDCSPAYFWLKLAKNHEMLIFYSFYFLPEACNCLFKLFQLTSVDGLWINKSVR